MSQSGSQGVELIFQVALLHLGPLVNCWIIVFTNHTSEGEFWAKELERLGYFSKMSPVSIYLENTKL